MHFSPPSGTRAGVSRRSIFYRCPPGPQSVREGRGLASCAGELEWDFGIGEILILPAGWAEASRRRQSGIRRFARPGDRGGGEGKMSRRAAGRHHAISESRRSSGWSASSVKARESLSDMAAIVLPSSCRTGTFWRPRAPRNRTSRFRLCAIACRPSAGSKRYLDDEPFLRQDRGDG